MGIEYNEVPARVRARLDRDPRLPYADGVAVDAYGSSVTLRGTVGSFAQQRAAVAIARRIPGVVDVVDELRVRLVHGDRRNDAEIRGAARQRLAWDPEVPGDVDVNVADGWVTLKGEVDDQFRSDIAFDRVAGLCGVTGVTNHIEVVERLRLPTGLPASASRS